MNSFHPENIVIPEIFKNNMFSDRRSPSPPMVMVSFRHVKRIPLSPPCGKYGWKSLPLCGKDHDVLSSLPPCGMCVMNEMKDAKEIRKQKPFNLLSEFNDFSGCKSRHRSGERFSGGRNTRVGGD